MAEAQLIDLLVQLRQTLESGRTSVTTAPGTILSVSLQSALAPIQTTLTRTGLVSNVVIVLDSSVTRIVQSDTNFLSVFITPAESNRGLLFVSPRTSGPSAIQLGDLVTPMIWGHAINSQSLRGEIWARALQSGDAVVVWYERTA